ncbi:MAG: hypothetical protein RMK17_02585, partial [bacterium]|nr:hypothetical protein [bacterium]
MKDDIFLEETLNEEWKRDLNLSEIKVSDKPFLYLGILILTLSLIIISRIIFLNYILGKELSERADINSGKKE